MDCQEFETELNRRLDERLDPRSSELQAHAAVCAPCQIQLHDSVLVLAGVAAWHQKIPAVTPDLAARIVERLELELVSQTRSGIAADNRQPTTDNWTTMELVRVIQPVMPERPSSSRRPTHQASKVELGSSRSADRPEPRHSWHTLAVMAGTVAALWFVFAASMLHDPADRKVSQHRPTVVEEPVPVVKPQVDIGIVIASAGEAYSQVANDSLEVAQDFALLWPTSSKPANTASPAISPAEGNSNWTPGWSKELAPISDSVEGTWDFLRRTVPQIEKSAS